MGKQIHILSEIDPEARTATCAFCGPVGVKRVTRASGYGWRCREAVRMERGGVPRGEPNEWWVHKRVRKRSRHLMVDHCEICGNKDDLCVDHDHEKLIYRGTLCRACNSGLGFFKDDVTKLEAAIVYLKKQKPDAC